MAHPAISFQLPNSSLENILCDVFACNYVFRLLIFERREFNETQIFALLPIGGRFLYPRTDVMPPLRKTAATIPECPPLPTATELPVLTWPGPARARDAGLRFLRRVAKRCANNSQ